MIHLRAACRLCLVTDPDMLGARSLPDLVDAAVAGGVTMVQLRDKARPTRAVIADARALQDKLRPLGIPLIINDRVDVALAVDADGVHVGQDDMPVATVRRLVGPDRIVGLSITSAAELAQADAGADYLGIGPVFAQLTKRDAAPALGLEGLAVFCRKADRPVMAIGGLGAANVAAVMAAGADGAAVVSAIMAADDPQGAARALRLAIDERLGALRRG